ncbi:MAG: hypothetical protein FWD61_07420 [Phycisphaerales bacterium]|nr:hypothetical protein [Phycisphaerales bacterium]
MAWLEKRNKTYMVCDRIGRKTIRIKAYTDKAASQAMLTRYNKERAKKKEGLTDPYAEHRHRPLSEHVGDWINDLRQLRRAKGYVRTVEGRMERLVKECRWKLLEDIDADSFADWREKAMGEYGHNAKDKKLLKQAKENPTPMSPTTKNHYLGAVRAFCLWCVKRKRMEANPIGELEKLDVSEDVRRGRRAITEEELRRLLAAVPERYQLLYKVALGTGLRAWELKAFPNAVGTGKSKRVAQKVANIGLYGQRSASIGPQRGKKKPLVLSGKNANRRSNVPIDNNEGDGARTRSQVAESSEKSSISSPEGSAGGSADLAVIVEAWPTLPAVLKSGILAMVQAANKAESK